MVVDLEFWEKGNARIVRSYIITTEESASEAVGEKFVAKIVPAVSNFPTGKPFDPILAGSHQEAKSRAIVLIKERPENNGLQSFAKMA
jgi:hypothetical protein